MFTLRGQNYLYDGGITWKAVVWPRRLAQCDVFNVTSPEGDELKDIMFGKNWRVCWSPLCSKTLHYLKKYGSIWF